MKRYTYTQVSHTSGFRPDMLRYDSNTLIEARLTWWGKLLRFLHPSNKTFRRATLEKLAILAGLLLLIVLNLVE